MELKGLKSWCRKRTLSGYTLGIMVSSPRKRGGHVEREGKGGASWFGEQDVALRSEELTCAKR